ncbi:HNH endonuclease [Hyphomonas sp.]|uniref:HNH endonuclease signature motif containing protein n=1 Tax=Hyphomonas sp. TaxID=87 RepID=UPI0025C11358|nr:HNH endonuclease [Hyphomonas sp.]
MPRRPKQFRPAGLPAQPSHAERDALRGSARARGYTSGWDVRSLLFRQRHPLCLGCEALGIITCTEVTDHIEPHKGNMAKFWDEDGNWQPACGWCHNVLKKRLEHMWSRREIEAKDMRLDSEVAVRVARELRALN